MTAFGMPGNVVVAAPLDAPAAHPPKNAAEAARQFEALLMAQILKAARGDEKGWLGTGDDSGDAMASELAEEQFAQALAQNGGLGLSNRIISSLSSSSTQAGLESPAMSRSR